MLRSNVIPVVPTDDFITHEFRDVKIVEEKVPVYDKTGNQVSELKKTRRKVVPIDKDIIGNVGISCAMFSLENQLAEGVPLTPFVGSFIKPDLSDSSNLGEEVINQINNLPREENVESSNNE